MCRTSTAASSPRTRITGLFAHRLFLEPCDKKTTYDTHNTTTVVNVTSYFNETRLENVTVTEEDNGAWVASRVAARRRFCR